MKNAYEFSHLKSSLFKKDELTKDGLYKIAGGIGRQPYSLKYTDCTGSGSPGAHDCKDDGKD